MKLVNTKKTVYYPFNLRCHLEHQKSKKTYKKELSSKHSYVRNWQYPV